MVVSMSLSLGEDIVYFTVGKGNMKAGEERFGQ
jgi:hypothetical protein